MPKGEGKTEPRRQAQLGEDRDGARRQKRKTLDRQEERQQGDSEPPLHPTPASYIIGKLLGQLGSLRPKISAQPQAAGSDS
jgi:hypothetical protein